MGPTDDRLVANGIGSERPKAVAEPMHLEMHQLELRYERLRRRSPRRERQLLASLDQIGQQFPIVVVGANDGRYVVVDGYKRVRALRRLAHDSVWALQWVLDESEALMLEQLMRAAGADTTLEQGWLLRELSERFGLGLEKLSERFDKSKSWVSRRLALVQTLPVEIQHQVCAGRIAPHAAMKYLVPLARANAQAAKALVEAIAPLRLSTRQMAVLYAGYKSGTDKSRELILTQPQVYLRAAEQADCDSQARGSPAQRLIEDLDTLSRAAQRVRRRLAQGLWQQLLTQEKQSVRRAEQRAKREAKELFDRMGLEDNDAQPEDAGHDSAIA